MKKNSVQLAILVLFSALFAPGAVVGMEKELPELEPQVLGAFNLPSDVRKIIANKALRVMLDEAEDNLAMLMEVPAEKKEEIIDKRYNPTNISEFFGFGPSLQTAARPIDTIILLIENGADPNTKNYMGNTVVSLLMKYFINISMGQKAMSISDFFKADHSFSEMVDILGSKLKLLARRKVNFNEIYKMRNFFSPEILGEDIDPDAPATVAHGVLLQILVDSKELIRLGSRRRLNLSIEERNLKTAWSFIFLLKDLGVDFTTVKDQDGDTACAVGQAFSQAFDIGKYSEQQLNILCSPPSKSWSFFK